MWCKRGRVMGITRSRAAPLGAALFFCTRRFNPIDLVAATTIGRQLPQILSAESKALSARIFVLPLPCKSVQHQADVTLVSTG